MASENTTKTNTNKHKHTHTHTHTHVCLFCVSIFCVCVCVLCGINFCNVMISKTPAPALPRSCSFNLHGVLSLPLAPPPPFIILPLPTFDPFLCQYTFLKRSHYHSQSIKPPTKEKNKFRFRSAAADYFVADGRSHSIACIHTHTHTHARTRTHMYAHTQTHTHVN